MSDVSFADNPGQARIAAERAAAVSPTPPAVPPAPPAVVAPAVPTFADNPGQARIQAEREAAAAAAVTPTSPITPVTPVVTSGDEGDDDGDTSGGGGGGGGNVNAFSPNPDARNTIKAVLATYGLDELSEVLYANYTSGLVDITDPRALIYSIREQPVYQKRFAANAARMKKGLTELSPSEYIGLEDTFRQLLRSNGLPAGFYDQPEDFTKFIEGDVSPQELQTRVQEGYAVVAEADPTVKRQMQELYGVTEGQLAAYFLDPERTAPLLKSQARAAQIGARALEQGGIQLSSTLAEDLARRGFTEQQAMAGFTEVGRYGELTQQFGGEAALTTEQAVGAAFGTDVRAQQELERRKRLRLGEFQGGGTFARATGDVAGSTQLGVGSAQ
jgi:hypothetical protein